MAAGHQEATVVVTSFKIIKFLIKSGFQGEAGLGIAAGKGTRRRRWAGRRENGQRLSPIFEGLAVSREGRRVPRDCGVQEGVSLESGGCWIGTGNPGCVFFLFPLDSFMLPSHSLHLPDFFPRLRMAWPHPRAIIFFSCGACDMTAFSLGKGHPWNT